MSNTTLSKFKYGVISIQPEEDFKELIERKINKIQVNIPKEYKTYYRNISQNNYFSKLNKDKLTYAKIIVAKENQTINLSTEDELTHQYILIIIPKGKEINIFEEFISNKNKFRNIVIEIIAEEDSILNYETFNQSKGYNFITRAALINKNANVTFNDINLGCKYTNLTSETHMNGEGSTGNHKGVFLTNKKEKNNIDIRSHHHVKNTSSDILSRGILSDCSQSLFNGLIKIYSDAPNSTGYQKLDSIMLSKNSESDAIPNLEIDNNNVSCSHGATIGQIDKEKIFYLMSRGISKKESQKLIIKGFIDTTNLNKEIIAKINKKIGEML